MAEVQLVSLSKRYGNVEVVHGIDLDIKDTEFIVLVGPSGCGKSTVLRMLAGLEPISGGEIRIGDRVVNEVSPKDRNVAMVFQNYALYPHMTVFENMAFSLKMSRRPKDEIDRTVREAAAVLELEHLLDRKPAALSGGQRQRVAMGRAIVRQPDVFLFDEPLSNLDAQLRTQMRLELKKMHRRLSTTTVYVTHDQIEAMTLADRIVILQGGRIQQVGTPAEVYDNPANVFVARFIGNPPMNIFAGAILVQDGQRVLQAGALTLPVPEHIVPSAENGRPVLAGLRPDAIKAGDSLQRLPDDWIRPADIGLAEVIGSQTLLELSTGGQTFLAEVKSRLQLQAGQTADIGFDMNRLVLFDPQTTLAMS